MQTSQLIIINQVNMPLSNTQVVLLVLKDKIPKYGTGLTLNVYTCICSAIKVKDQQIILHI